jgi:hypothetical protein
MEQIFTKLIGNAPKIIAAAGKSRLTLIALGILAGCGVAVAYLHSPAAISQIVGKDSVVMYAPPNAHVEDGSVVIGATDGNGNIMLRQTVAVGRGAYAAPGSIAIGAGAGAGMRPSDTTPAPGGAGPAGINEPPQK